MLQLMTLLQVVKLNAQKDHLQEIVIEFAFLIAEQVYMVILLPVFAMTTLTTVLKDTMGIASCICAFSLKTVKQLQMIS